MKKIENAIMKKIIIKVPYKKIWLIFGIIILLSPTWLLDKLPDRMFWAGFIVVMTVITYFLYLLRKFYSRKSVKQITINDDNIVFVFQLRRYGTPGSFEYSTNSQYLKVRTKGNVMNILEKGEPIARLYKNTMQDKDDWGWLINYFKE